MRILLVEVGTPRNSFAWTAYFDDHGRFAMPSVGLLSLASLARPTDEVRIVDEKVAGEVDTVDADLVGISFKSMYARRAYALADRLRRQGLKVVLGGIHASLQPEQAAAHADAVVVGEGEALWRQVLDDLEAGKPRAIYRTPATPLPLDSLPRLPVRLVDHTRYMCHSTQSARGCSFTCEFCPTRTMFGEGYRLRNPDTVMSEVREMVALADKPVFFTENVFGAGDRPYIDELTSRLQASGVRYAVICDWLAMSPDLAGLLADRGCGLVGINLTGRPEPAEEAALEAIHAAGLPMWGYLMFGFEEDEPDVFRRAVERIRRYGIVSVALTVLTPYPGTPMAARMEHEGRVFGRDSDLFDQNHVLFEPKHMNSRELEQGYAYVCQELDDLLGFHRAVEAMNRQGTPRNLRHA
jgi:radical SAM superfamily enzyme YgiQ (UPF0313 family)